MNPLTLSKLRLWYEHWVLNKYAKRDDLIFTSWKWRFRYELRNIVEKVYSRWYWEKHEMCGRFEMRGTLLCYQYFDEMSGLLRLEEFVDHERHCMGRRYYKDGKLHREHRPAIVEFGKNRKIVSWAHYREGRQIFVDSFLW